MSLKEILTRMVEAKADILLNNAAGSFTPSGLLDTLSLPKLNTRSYYQSGLYIAEINDSGYLGAVLYKVEKG